MELKKTNTTSPWSTSQWNTSEWKDVPNPLQGTILENPTAALWCYHNNEKCFFSVGKYLTYDCPKNAVEATWSTAQWVGNQALNLGNKFFSKAYLQSGLENPKEPLGTSIYAKACDSFNKINEQTTSWALQKNAIELNPSSNINSNTEIPFSAVDLLGPGLLMGFTANKALDNAKSVVFNCYLLLSGRRTVTTTYKSPPQLQTMSINAPRDFMNTMPYSSKMILLNILMESLFAGIWGGAAYLSFQSIKEALVTAGAEQSRAHMLTNSLLVSLTVVPHLYSFAKACLENEDSVEGPVAAPHLAYVDPNDFTPNSVDLDDDLKRKIFRESPQNSDNNNPLGLLTNSRTTLF